MTELDTKTEIEITGKHFFLYINIFLLPVFVSWITFVWLRIFDLKETLIGFTSPVAVIGISMIYAFVLFWWFSQTKRLKSYNPKDPDSVAAVNKTYKRFQTVTLGTGILNAFFSALIVQGAFAQKQVFVDAAPLYTACFGNVFLIAQAFYSLFVQNLERSLKVVPFSREFKTM